jgi:hypothetical protein
MSSRCNESAIRAALFGSAGPPFSFVASWNRLPTPGQGNNADRRRRPCPAPGSLPRSTALPPKHRRPNTAPRVSSPPASMPMAGASPIISIDDAGDWAHKEGHVVWIASWSPMRNCCTAWRTSSACTISPSRMRSMPISGRSSSNMAKHSSWWRGRRKLEEGRVVFGETHVFIGRGYIVSVRHGASTSYAAVRQHWEACPSSLARGVGRYRISSSTLHAGAGGNPGRG